MTPLRAPFPWTGGKSRVGHVVWKALGNPPNYIEPFFGSGAVMLGRPGGAGKIETVNDIDGGLVNFWRAMKWAPRTTAKWCDWPVSELDLHARHSWLIEKIASMREELRADPYYYDAQVAGWWVWGICQWIGTGWCDPALLERNKGARPHISANHTGMGVHSTRKRPELGNKGKGVTLMSSLPAIGNDRGLNGVSAPPCLEWFLSLQKRFRNTRIICGDWRRVLGPSVLGKGKNVGGRTPTGIFFDPPYDPELRQKRLYAEDDPEMSRLVREFCLEHGDDPDLRIALCGYEGEHVMPSTWECHAWKGARGYASSDNENRSLERIWFSPHCLPLTEVQRSLFAGAS